MRIDIDNPDEMEDWTRLSRERLDRRGVPVNSGEASVAGDQRKAERLGQGDELAGLDRRLTGTETAERRRFRCARSTGRLVTSSAMKLSMMISYSGDFHADVAKVVELEKAGLDVVWVPEAYSFDAVSQMGYLAAKTDTIEIGSAILNVFSRTATCMAQTAAGLDFVSGGRFILGLGASGPQVIEGFHGVPYEKPMPRIRDYINVCRMTLEREKVIYDGPTVQIPLPEGQGTGLGKALKLINHPVRNRIPIFWASLMGQSVKNTAEFADGWLPIFFDPEKFHNVWGDDIKAGNAKRDPELGPLQISAGGMVAIGEDLVGDKANAILDSARPSVALYVGGMGARDKNFYNTIMQKYGYEDEAIAIQDNYLAGEKDKAAALVPADMLANTNLVGPKSYVKERLAAYSEAGVTHLSVSPVGKDAVTTIEELKTLLP
jgi:F420-dependent oxidoreductase-like protein